MSKELEQAIFAGVVVIAVAYWLMGKKSGSTGVYATSTYGRVITPFNESPDRILNPGENGAVWV